MSGTCNFEKLSIEGGKDPHNLLSKTSNEYESPSLLNLCVKLPSKLLFSKFRTTREEELNKLTGEEEEKD